MKFSIRCVMGFLVASTLANAAYCQQTFKYGKALAEEFARAPPHLQYVSTLVTIAHRESLEKIVFPKSNYSAAQQQLALKFYPKVSQQKLLTLENALLHDDLMKAISELDKSFIPSYEQRASSGHPYPVYAEADRYVLNQLKKARERLAGYAEIDSKEEGAESQEDIEPKVEPPSPVVEEQAVPNGKPPKWDDVFTDIVNQVDWLSAGIIEGINNLPLPLPEYEIENNDSVGADTAFIMGVIVELAFEAGGIRVVDKLGDVLPKLPIWDDIADYWNEIRHSEAGAINPKGPRPKEVGAESASSTIKPKKGTFAPRNLAEQLAIRQAMSNPSAGRELPGLLTDARWSAEEGWQKMSMVVKPRKRSLNQTEQAASFLDKIEVHYVYNPKTGAADDFKIVDRTGTLPIPED